MKKLLLLLSLALVFASLPAFAAPPPTIQHDWDTQLAASIRLGPQLFAALTPGAPGNPPSVTLTWGASTTTGVSYNVYDATTTGGEKKPVLANVSGGALTYTDTTLTFGITRYYTVTACTGCSSSGTGGAESTQTNEVSVQIPVQPSPPGTLQTPVVVYP